MLIPKFLLLTIAVIQKTTKPIVNPLIESETKSNHSTALDQNLRSKKYPATQNTKLIMRALTKYVNNYVK